MARIPRRLARGSSAEVAGYTGPLGEPVVDTTTLRLHLQDGATPGGIAIPTKAEVDAAFVAVDDAIDAIVQRLPRGYIAGLILSNNAVDAVNDIDIGAGTARDAGDGVNLVLASALTKRLDANWFAGHGNGGLDTGSAADGTYHVHLIRRSDTGVVDALFSLSPTAPDLPPSYDAFRRLGSILRESGTIAAFLQDGDWFWRTVPVLDVAATNPGTAAVNRTLSVPAGIRTIAMMIAGGSNGSNNWFGLISSLDQADTVPSSTVFNCGVTSPTVVSFYSTLLVRTDTGRQVRSRISVSGASDLLRISTLGWIDRRTP
ncbi:hypothetical protein [Bosea sp. (in: a-proteobacteria)]|uniref:hyaluronate lyase N-terminal domain-containing protein n=1 Tax=Bosea sp. (in: a-proteobacteria) TaxID=1871050 RepID=UPI00261AAABA|nr:hypothetical protein [Bosea sp. (in: a-proteobacteria)]MCO5092003.1 hypothetical protein [Bosea sp. (in: a-proteobacteria)]